MKTLLLLDADIIIDLHSLDLFNRILKAYSIKVTRDVFKESRYYRRGSQKIPIDLKGMVGIIDEIEVKSLHEIEKEAREARLIIDSGELTSIAYLIENTEEILFCSADRAALVLISYMDLENRAVSLEKACRDSSIHIRHLPKHSESRFKEYIREGKISRVQNKI